MNAYALLLLLTIALTWARLVRPGLNRLHGTSLLVVTLPLLARIRMHAIPFVLTTGLTGVFILRGDLPWWSIVAPVASSALMVAIPIRYTLTSLGIRLGWTSFHRWTEFAGVRRAPGGARLVGVQRAYGRQIWLSGSRGDDEFLHYLRQSIRNAYQGKSGVIPLPPGRNPVESDSLHESIAAFTAER